jgi:hypothetical protein
MAGKRATGILELSRQLSRIMFRGGRCRAKSCEVRSGRAAKLPDQDQDSRLSERPWRSDEPPTAAEPEPAAG